MRGAGQLVARAPAEAFIIGAHRIVDLACRGAEFRCGKGDILPLAHLIPHLPLARARLAIDEIGRASCRERVCKYVEITVVAVALQTKTTVLRKSLGKYETTMKRTETDTIKALK